VRFLRIQSSIDLPINENCFQGLAKYVLEHVRDAKDKGLVIGHDHRHHSQTFARLTAAVFISLGFKVWFFRQLVHTPLVVSTSAKYNNAVNDSMISLTTYDLYPMSAIYS
jgi:phosphomannomutase